jgi:hypothetical protein
VVCDRKPQLDAQTLMFVLLEHWSPSKLLHVLSHSLCMQCQHLLENQNIWKKGTWATAHLWCFWGVLVCGVWRRQIGISAPQGCGKTTIVYSLEYLFNSLGRCVHFMCHLIPMFLV